MYGCWETDAEVQTMSTADKTSALQAALNTQVVKANLLYGAERLYINVY